MEKIAGKSAYTYILREGDKQIRHTISYCQYFALSRYYDVDEYIEDLLERQDGWIRLTERGIDVSNYVFAEFME